MKVMNKILLAKNEITGKDVKILGNKITIDNDGEYVLEYTENGKYQIEFIINANVKLIEVSYDKKLDNHNKYCVNGSLEIVKFYNNKSVLETIDIDLLRENAKVDYHFANICKEEERYTININHLSERTYSNIINRSIALKNSILASCPDHCCDADQMWQRPEGTWSAEDTNKIGIMCYQTLGMQVLRDDVKYLTSIDVICWDECDSIFDFASMYWYNLVLT